MIDEDRDGLDDLDTACILYPTGRLGWRCTVHFRHLPDRPPWALVTSRWFLTRHLALGYASSWRPVRLITLDH